MRNLVMAAAGAILFGLPAASHATVTVDYLHVETDAVTWINAGINQYADYETFVDENLAAPQVIGRISAANASVGDDNFAAYVGSNFVFPDNEHIMLDVAGAWNWNPGTIGDLGNAEIVVILNYFFSTSATYAYNLTYDSAWDSYWTNSKGRVSLSSLSGLLANKVTAPNDNGSFSGIIGPGQYMLGLVVDNLTKIDRRALFGPPLGGGNSHFTFSLLAVAPQGSAVPEPGTWAMMIGGFALAGGILRRGKIAIRLI